MLNRLRDLSLPEWAGIVLAAGLLLRLGLWLAYMPVSYSDTNSYRRLAASILEGWGNYDGTRTPGYPLLLAAGGPDEQVWLIQMGLGLGTTMLLFGMGWLLSGKAWFAGLAGLAHTLNLGQLFFEANLITETLATFAATASLAGAFLWLLRPARRGVPLAVLIALAASLAWLVRPLLIYLPFWLLLFLAAEFRDSQPAPPPESPAERSGKSMRGNAPEKMMGKQFTDRFPKISISWARAALYLVPVLLILGAWVSFIQDRFHVWSLTAMSGYHLMQHTGNYFELLPDEEAPLRDTYLKYREIQIAERGSQANTIWDAIPEMQQVSGLSFYALSRKLSELSVQLILDNPDLYLRYAVGGWWLFWRAPVYWSAEALRWDALRPVLAAAILLERAALVGSNLLFVVTSVAVAVSRKARRVWRIGAPLWCLAGGIWIASILQALVDHGDNPRFLVPLQSLVVLWVLWVSVKSFERLSGRTQPPPDRGSALAPPSRGGKAAGS